MMMLDAEKIRIAPLTGENWPDLEALFGPRGAVGGCWCMYWRQTQSRIRSVQRRG